VLSSLVFSVLFLASLRDFNEFCSLFDNAARIGASEYVPTQVDILRARIKTTGISENRFTMGNLSICLIDVGGQISERKKWIHTFENVTSIIFCVSLAEYDQVLLEDPSQSRMLDSFALFESIVNSQWFRHTSIILFLNKTDMFKRRLAISPLRRFFEEYRPSDSTDLNVEFDNASAFLKSKFLGLNHHRLPIYPHFTCATDTQQIETVFAAVQETILSDVLKNTGLL
jgi:guanine nucleotide-binding protein G(i) subunit alpha